MPAIYRGGEYRQQLQEDTGLCSVSLALESVAWTHQDMCIWFVIHTLIGSANQFSEGGPGKGMYSRAFRNLLGQNDFIHSVSCINNTFSDSGIFGITLEGPNEYSYDLLLAIIKELCLLRDRTTLEQELNRAKNIVKMNLL